jgi:hypothetical protein
MECCLASCRQHIYDNISVELLYLECPLNTLRSVQCMTLNDLPVELTIRLPLSLSELEDFPLTEKPLSYHASTSLKIRNVI